jgi:hypothetical protein
MKHEIEEGALGGQYKQPKAKLDRGDFKELMDNQRASSSAEESP